MVTNQVGYPSAREEVCIVAERHRYRYQGRFSRSDYA